MKRSLLKSEIDPHGSPETVLQITAEEIEAAVPLSPAPLPLPYNNQPESAARGTAAQESSRSAGRLCPMCGCVSPAFAAVCSGCGEAFLADADDAERNRERARKRMQATAAVPFVKSCATALFCLSFLAVFSPMIIPAGIWLLWRHHRSLSLAGSLFRVLTCSAMFVSLVYLVAAGLAWAHAG